MADRDLLAAVNPSALRQLQHLSRLGYVLVIPAVVVVAALGLWVVSSGIADVRGADLNVLFTLLKALGGAALYTDPEDVPFDVAQYGPLQYLLVLALAGIGGITDREPATLLAIARGVSMTCGLLLALGGFAFARRVLKLSRPVAGVAAGLAWLLTSPWFFLARPDAMATLLALSSLAAVVVPAARIRPGRLAVAALLIVAAVFTKQSEVQVAAVLVLYVAWVSGWRVGLGVALAIGLLGVTLTLLLASHWPFFLDNVVGGVDNGVDLRNLLDKTLGSFLLSQGALIALAGVALATWISRPADSLSTLFVVSLPMLFLSAIAFGLKTGSAENYFVEFAFMAVFAVAWLTGSGEAGLSNGQRALMSQLVGLLVLIWVPVWVASQARDYWLAKVHFPSSWSEPVGQVDSEATRALADWIARAGLEHDEYVLAFPLSLNVQLPRLVLVPQKEVATILHERGVLDYAQFASLVTDDRVRYLVIESGQWSSVRRPFLGVRFDGYVLLETVGGFSVFGRPALP